MRTAAFWRQTPVGVAFVLASAALLTGMLAPFRNQVGLLNEGLLFLLLTLLVAAVWGRNVGLLAALVTNLCLNFFFIDPFYRFTVQEPRNIVALVVFLAVSVIGGTLLSAARQSAAEARRRQAETEVALNLSRALSGQTEPQQALSALCEVVVAAFFAPGAAVLTPVEGRWSVLAHAGAATASRDPDQEERATAERCVAQGSLQGLGITGLDGARPRRLVIPRGRGAAFSRRRVLVMVPLRLGSSVLGVLRLDGPIGDSPFREQPERLLTAVASEAALAVQRSELARAAAHAEALREVDELKTALLNAVSHDLRTPLASIIASAGSLQQTDVSWTETDRREFAESIEHEAQRLNRLVGNLLDLSRVESGSLQPQKGWYDLGALIDDVVGRLAPLTSRHHLRVTVKEELPPVLLDYIEIDEVLTNLLENAVKYAPPGTEIELSARRSDADVLVEVADNGPGLPEDALQQVFEPFVRLQDARAKGTGLGLAVARGLVSAHGGRIWAENRPDGGAAFRFTLPLSPVPESLPVGDRS